MCYDNDCDYGYAMYKHSNSISHVIIIVIITVIVLITLIVIVRLSIHVIFILLFDYYIDITTCSIVNVKGTCILHNRNCNHVNRDGNYSITLISVANHRIAINNNTLTVTITITIVRVIAKTITNIFIVMSMTVAFIFVRCISIVLIQI